MFTWTKVNGRRLVVAAVFGALAWTSLGAQQPEPAPTPAPSRDRARDRARVRVTAPGAYAFAYSDMDRGVIGITPSNEANPATDSVGVKLNAVTPGSPAARAGLRAGDIITKYNGTVLGGQRSEDSDISGPAQKLLELARSVEAGDTVKLEYRRGTERKTASVVAVDYVSVYTEPEMSAAIAQMENAMKVQGDVERAMAAPWGGVGFAFGSWSDMELVSLNPELGEYFGTREGVLVVKAPNDSSLGLKSGDVILSVSGRKPTSPSHLMRILRSYEPGESVTIDVMRRQRRVTVNGAIPERRSTTIRRTPRAPRGPFAPGEIY